MRQKFPRIPLNSIQLKPTDVLCLRLCRSVKKNEASSTPKQNVEHLPEEDQQTLVISSTSTNPDDEIIPPYQEEPSKSSYQIENRSAIRPRDSSCSWQCESDHETAVAPGNAKDFHHVSQLNLLEIQADDLVLQVALMRQDQISAGVP
ncbi:unnamed protein product, partial [Cyprideis torosa]